MKSNNRVGKCPSPLLAALGVRLLADIFPLDARVHKN